MLNLITYKNIKFIYLTNYPTVFSNKLSKDYTIKLKIIKWIHVLFINNNITVA